MKIYTKTGDRGETSLLGGQKVIKSHLRLEAYGAVDELNSSLGLLIAFIREAVHAKTLKTEDLDAISELLRIQEQLFVMASHLACPDAKHARTLPELPESAVTDLEHFIDQANRDLPELRNFILPGGTLSSSQAQVSRTICRRTERAIVRFYESEPTSRRDTFIKYMNRLSDHLFTLSRWLNKKSGEPEQLWKGTSG